MSRYAIIDAGNIVQQVVLWDGNPGWAPPEGQTAVLLPDDDFFIEARGTLDDKTMIFVRAEAPVVNEEDLLAIPGYADEKAKTRMGALLDVLADKGTITPEDVAEIETAKPNEATP